MRAIWMSALLVGCGAYLEAQGAARPRFEAAMQAFWDATSVGDREDAGRRIVASGASFEKVVRSLKTGRTYGKQQTGRIELSSRITAWCWTMPSRSRQRMTLLDHRRCVRWRM